MKHASHSRLFKEQIAHIGEKRAKIVLDNFILVEQALRYALRYNNISNLSMIVKPENSAYSVKYTYRGKEQELVAVKLLE